MAPLRAVNSSGSSQALIARLLELPAAERAAALQRACTENPALSDALQELGHLLRPSFAKGAEQINLAARAFAEALECADPEVSGNRIGPYKLLQEIGEGGFGVVWMAEQLEPIRRRVAVKVIKIGMDTREVIARFEAERQALALMDHPNIARVLDAGATETGRPFFVMELVRGVPITRYCDENRLPTQERLRLFVSICQAVQHAHQKGVIHRDLKPSNILVTLHDGVPVPKIIDFGIAKATGTRLTDKTLVTQFHAFIGTPAYTSPEQVEMSGLDVDTRSDIYSLGVLLYELLAGRPPFDPDALAKSGLDAMRRTIREVDPPRPSHRLSTLSHEDRITVAQRRGTEVGKLSLLLRGDLDWIVMRCLEKDRTRRYETANGLAMDVSRYLANEPVVARPPSQFYRLTKFIGRHKLGFAAATAVSLSLVAGLIASSFLLVRERIAHSRAAKAEQAETRLRQQAEVEREVETKRVGQAALTLAGQLLEEGRTADALAYFVHAARKDPDIPTIAPRLLSVLTSRNFLLPQGAPFQCESRVLAIRFSQYGHSLFIGTADGVCRTFDAVSGQLRREFRVAKPVQFGGWVFARNTDDLVAARFEDNTLSVYDLASGRRRWGPIELTKDVPAVPGFGGVRDPVSLSPDGRWLGVRGTRSFGLWDTANGDKRLALPGAEPFDFSPDGTRLAFTIQDRLHIWSLPEATQITEPITIDRPQPSGWLLSRFSPNGRLLVVCDPWARLHLFDSASGAKLKSLDPWNDDFVKPIAMGFAPDGRFFTSGNLFSRRWDLTTGHFKELPLPGGSEGVREKAFDASGRFLLINSSDGFARLWDIETGAMVAEPTLQQEIDFEAGLSPDATQIVIGTRAGAVHRLRVGNTAARPLVLPRSQPLTPAEFLPGAPSRLLWFASDRARVLDVSSGHEVAGGFSYPGPVSGFGNSSATSSSVKPGLKFVIMRSQDGPLQAWEYLPAGSARAVPLQNSREDALSPFAFSSAADRVTGILRNKARAVWDLRTGEQVGQLDLTSESIMRFTGNASPDGRRFLCGTADGKAVAWDVASGRPVLSILAARGVPTRVATYSPDGTRILTVNDAELRMWDAATGEPRSPVALHTDEAGAEFSPDGRVVASYSSIAVRFWDSRTLTMLGSTIRIDGARSGKFSPDGKRFIVVNSKGDARVWDVGSGQLVTERMQHGPVRVVLGVFSPDGKFARTETAPANYHLWSLPPPQPEGTPAPEWLLELATMFASKRVNADGQLVDASDAVAKIDDLRRHVATLPDNDPFGEWGRWILDDRADRSIAPGFTITPAEADRLTRSLPRTRPE